MAFLPSPDSAAPVHDANTDEIVVNVEGTGAAQTVPPQCVYMVFAISDVSSGMSTTPGIYLTSDAADRDSGIFIDNSSGGMRIFGCAFEPGTSFFMHTEQALGDEVEVNITRYYKKQ